MRISDWSSDVCSSDLEPALVGELRVLLGQVGVHAPGQVEEVAEVPRERCVLTDEPSQRRVVDGLGVDALADLRQLLGVTRAEERRVGKAGVSTCRSRWSPYP